LCATLQLPNKQQCAEGCDATGLYSSIVAGQIKITLQLAVSLITFKNIKILS